MTEKGEPPTQKADIKSTGPKSTEQAIAKNKKWYQKDLTIIVALIFLFPLGLYLMFKYASWKSRTKKIVTAVVALMVALSVWGYIMAPPTVNANLASSKNPAQEGSTYSLKGDVFPYGAQLTVNDVPVQTNSQGEFSYKVPLKEGDNTILVVAKDGDKVTIKSYKVHRLTKAEVAKRKASKQAGEAQAAQAKQVAAEAKARTEAAQKAAAKKTAEAKKAAAAKKAAEAQAKTAAEAQRKAQEEAARNAPKTTFRDGTYLVNKQIAAGTYKSDNLSGSCYYARLSGTGGTFDEIIANGNPDGQAIVTIAPSDVAFQSSRCDTWNRI